MARVPTSIWIDSSPFQGFSARFTHSALTRWPLKNNTFSTILKCHNSLHGQVLTCACANIPNLSNCCWTIQLCLCRIFYNGTPGEYTACCIIAAVTFCIVCSLVTDQREPIINVNLYVEEESFHSFFCITKQHPFSLCNIVASIIVHMKKVSRAIRKSLCLCHVLLF